MTIQAALIQHTNRAFYQASIWTTCLKTQQSIPNPEGFGWTHHEQCWKPVWTLLPEAATACQELLKCGCKALPLCSKKCKCRDAGLSCTPLCFCGPHQQLFMEQVKSLSEVISSMGNPFLDDFPELVVLDTRNCVSDAVVSTVKTIEELGCIQYDQYVKDVIKNRTVSIHNPIKKNCLSLFKRPLLKKPSKIKHTMVNLKSECNLFSHLYIASRYREGNLEDFFAHENQSWPPSLSEQGKLRLPSKKSDLLTIIDAMSNIS